MIGQDSLVKLFKKIPDGFVLAEGSTRGLDPDVIAADWIEVEGAYKTQDEHRKMLNIALRIGDWIDKDRKILLDRLVLVYSSQSSHQKSLVNGVDRFVREHKIENPAILGNIVLAECEIAHPFKFLGYTERAWSQIQSRSPIGPGQKAVQWAGCISD